jgi:predicted DNA-binding transcriptional regulator YafY
MAEHSSRSQLCRLLQLILALHAKRFPNARTLAELCEVSRRTVYRDLGTLEACGVRVQYHSERQGYYLTGGFLLHPPNLEEDEARALCLLLKGNSPAHALGLEHEAERGAWKWIATLPEDLRQRVQVLAEGVDDRSVKAEPAPERIALYREVLSALMVKKQVNLWYCDRQSLECNTTKVSPYRLLVDGPRWFLLGRSSLHSDVSIFALDWIKRVS